jgi:hypothetical protein
MTNTIYIHQPEKAVSFTRLPNFLFEAPTFTPLSTKHDMTNTIYINQPHTPLPPIITMSQENQAP